MNLLFLLPLFQIFKYNLVLGNDVRMPPSIVQWTEKESRDYREDDKIVMKCVAEGIPKPEYEWLKDNKPLTSSERRNIFVEDGEATISILHFGSSDEGTYQCRAYNQYGSALTRKVVIRKAVLAQYPNKVIMDSPMLREGTPYMLSCQPTKCHPKPTFSWTLVSDTEDKEERTINTDQRIQMDEDGNLHFSYLLSGDSQDGKKLYKCRLFNNILDMIIGGSYSRLNISPVATITPFPPEKMFSTKSPLVGLETQTIVMKCIFSGYPTPKIYWLKDGGSLPIGRYHIGQNSELTISNLKPTDAGIYRCSAQNTQSQNVSEVVEVKIEAVPVFRNGTEMPNDVNVTEGSDVVIKCRPYATPKADVKWFRNGSPLDPINLPRKFGISADGNTLTISDLCKSCSDGSSDLAVIQCNASNAHGYAFEDAYINVLERTRITLRPENISLGVEDETAEFLIDVTTDDLTPLTLHWYRLNSKDNQQYLHSDEPYVKVSDDKRRVTFYLPQNYSTKREEYRGLYKILANNSYSIDVVNVYLDVKGLPEIIQPPIASQAGLAELWWILVVVAGLFLLLIILLLCCICCYRNRGDVYPVDKKERKNGNDPEKELKDSGFFDYKRPEAQPVKGSRVSLSSTISVSEEEASLNEYGDIDAGKFTEEGSFIGDYRPSPGHKGNHVNHTKA